MPAKTRIKEETGAKGAFGIAAAAFSDRARLTPSGAVFSILTVSVGALAWFTASNFLFALFSIMGSAIVLSALSPLLSVRGITLDRTLPPEIFAGVEARVGVTVANGKKRVRTMDLTVRDMVDLPAFHDGPPAYFPAIPSGGHSRAELLMRFRRRGRYRATAWSAESGSPFGFFRARVTGTLAGEFLVFPRPRRMSSSVLPEDVEMTVWGRKQASRTGEEDEFKGLRSYVRGDPRNRIHWRSSARTGSLMVRENESFSLPRVTLLLDTSDSSGVSGLRKGVGIERGVRIAASLAADLSARGVEFRFGATNLTPPITRFGCGQTHLRSVLEILAELGPSQGGGESLFEHSGDAGGLDCFVVLVLSRRRASEVAAMLGRSGKASFRVLDVSAPDKGRAVRGSTGGGRG